jgi:hypothetical protein
MDDDRETLESVFEDVRLAATVSHPWSMPYENFDVYVCRRIRIPLEELWPRLKNFH